ncbi:hypothetical protein B0H14DRAFT_3873269 [Mycena olivaceomarginata]|nr:hypothetical protein B0H14DRAFT_3873269 [Mycena olivaceomarginata]
MHPAIHLPRRINRALRLDVEDDELVDPDDELYDARYSHSPVTSPQLANSLSGYRGRTSAGPDITRSRSQSLAPTTGATATAIGTGRAGAFGASNIGSAANSYSNAYLYGNNAYGHPYGTGGTQWVARRELAGRELAGREVRGSPLVRSSSISSGGGGGEDGTNMSPFVRDVGSILLDDGSFGSCGSASGAGGSFHRARAILGVRVRGMEAMVGFAPRDRDRDVRDTHPSSYTLYQQQRGEFDPRPARERRDLAPPQRLRRAAAPPPRGLPRPRRRGRRLAVARPVRRPGGTAGRGGGASSNNNGRGFGGGGLLLSDDDLEIGLGLSLHSATSPSNAYGGGFGQRRREDSLSGRYDERGY